MRKFAIYFKIIYLKNTTLPELNVFYHIFLMHEREYVQYDTTIPKYSQNISYRNFSLWTLPILICRKRI